MSRMPVRCNVIQSFDWSEEKLQHSLNRAQQAHVSRNKSSKEFRNARITDDSDENPYWYWRLYKRRCHWRHKWDQFLRSNLDWDWDLSSSLKKLFKIDSPPHGQPSLKGDSLDLLITTDCDGPPKEIRVAYKTKDGEIRYQAYTALSGIECPASYSLSDHVAQGLSIGDEADVDPSSRDDRRTRHAKEKVEIWLEANIS